MQEMDNIQNEFPSMLGSFVLEGEFHLVMSYRELTQEYILKNNSIQLCSNELCLRTMLVMQWNDFVAFVTPTGIQFIHPVNQFYDFGAPIQLAVSYQQYLLVSSFNNVAVFQIETAGNVTKISEMSFANEISAISAFVQNGTLLVSVCEWSSELIHIMQVIQGTFQEYYSIPSLGVIKSCLFLEQKDGNFLLTCQITGEVHVIQIFPDSWRIQKQVDSNNPEMSHSFIFHLFQAYGFGLMIQIHFC